MVHLNVSHAVPTPDVRNGPCQHAFALMGRETIFAVHLTQYHCDKHRYQVILRISLPDDAREEFLRMRAEHPDAGFFFCNGEAPDEKFSIPALGAGNIQWQGARGVMQGNIFYGFRGPKIDPPPPDWFPWNLADTIPMIANVSVIVERVVLFRPFSLGDIAPPKATYMIFGQGDEAHMTNIQTGQLVTGPRDLPLYGLDVDHIMSLDHAPEWLDKDMLEAGTIVTLPAVDRYDAQGDLIVHEKPPFDIGDPVMCLYRGLQPARALTAGSTWFYSSEVCNSHELTLTTPGINTIVTEMPTRYWR
ncbi:MAG: hypothetical protein AAGL89_01990 [Pseudomonadota bacterium]